MLHHELLYIASLGIADVNLHDREIDNIYSFLFRMHLASSKWSPSKSVPINPWGPVHWSDCYKEHIAGKLFQAAFWEWTDF
jgi:hypothetical protein